MTIKQNVALKLFLFMLSVAIILTCIPQQAAARRGKSSVHRSSNSSKNTNKNRNVNSNKNTNKNTNVNVNVDVDRRRGGHRHPVAIGAAVVVTAAVVGSIVYSLPPSGCTTVIRNGIHYSQCGTVWYEPRYSGNSVTYVVINNP